MNYQVSGTALSDYPVELAYGLIYVNDGILEIPMRHPFNQGWGKFESFMITDTPPESYPLAIEICYLSIAERKFYEAQMVFPDELFPLMWESDMEFITFGMGPSGRMAMWLSGEKKCILLADITAPEVDMDLSDLPQFNPAMSVEEFCSQFDGVGRGNAEDAKHRLDPYMKQYRYKLIIDLPSSQGESEKSGNSGDHLEVKVGWIDIALYDGSYDKTNNDRLFQYHDGGIPDKVRLTLEQGKTEWQINLWFEDSVLSKIFERFYGAHTETKTDFIIRIDAENKKYELALYRQGLKEPVVIPESAYQLIVFKNKFEDYRSENYNQPHGAWIW